ncbi:hypothetical protein KBZ12_08030 [Cyanobium sp. Cruz CV13-4-11]|jgi:hypothetical protein|uniref:hypothetical protein n=1 Tax=unclassified Cyanobium TaxID=2627006 RepID=UPI0020CFC376|nr:MULTISPECIES: hypothetical protein [unclassified Cyanobium]MCP9900351.1 hypothetical protein [Cyanobium sp. Cruz CV11-17]MCP9919434.1 hypothetical protein [Cyanobium sp. Cruz CV13-4-11]
MSVLDQAAARLERARSSVPPASPFSQLGDIVRTSVACLALAAGFAGLARRPGSNLSLLAELQLGWQRLCYSKASLRRGSGPGGADPDYFRRLSEQAEAEEAEQRR